MDFNEGSVENVSNDLSANGIWMEPSQSHLGDTNAKYLYTKLYCYGSIWYVTVNPLPTIDLRR